MPQRHATPDDLPPEFDNVDSRDIGFALAQTKPLIGLAAWGDNASIGHALAASHVLKASGKGSNGSTGQQPFSIKVGTVSRTNALSNPGHAEWGGTQYGRDFLNLRKTIVGGPLVV